MIINIICIILLFLNHFLILLIIILLLILDLYIYIEYILFNGIKPKDSYIYGSGFYFKCYIISD